MSNPKEPRCNECERLCEPGMKCRCCREPVCVRHAHYDEEGRLLCPGCMEDANLAQTEQLGAGLDPA